MILFNFGYFLKKLSEACYLVCVWSHCHWSAPSSVRMRLRPYDWSDKVYTYFQKKFTMGFIFYLHNIISKNCYSIRIFTTNNDKLLIVGRSWQHFDARFRATYSRIFLNFIYYKIVGLGSGRYWHKLYFCLCQILSRAPYYYTKISYNLTKEHFYIGVEETGIFENNKAFYGLYQTPWHFLQTDLAKKQNGGK